MGVHDGTVGTSEALDIADDVQRNHVGHMTACTRCTWWYCEHYACDCHESCIGQHDMAGHPLRPRARRRAAARWVRAFIRGTA